MHTRRSFLKCAAAGSIVTAAIAPVARAARIKSVGRCEDTVLRYGGFGDNWHMTWATDGLQYVSQCDGFGWSEKPKGLFNSRMYAISGGPRQAKFHELGGYPEFIPPLVDSPRYYNFGTLALDGRLYQFLSTLNVPIVEPNARFIGAKLIYSPDNGRTWHNQNGSTPVAWEPWDQRSRNTMMFFEEDQEAFSLLSVLQMGKNYEHNRDGYVYVYAPNGNTEGTMNELVMCRVPKTRILSRDAYEFFAGRGANGGAKWTRDIAARAIVHVFPRGWVNAGGSHPFAWQPSVVFNAPLDVYMMASWGTGCGPRGMWFDRPSYLGLWIAPNAWGPWTQIHEEAAWLPASDKNSRAFAPQIAPKWIAPNGESFWLVWSDFQESNRDAFYRFYDEETKAKYRQMRMSGEEWVKIAEMMRTNRPYYGFNVQRVELTLV